MQIADIDCLTSARIVSTARIILRDVSIGLPIWIDDGVWIGANSTTLPGVTIGRKSVIGAGSVVVDDIPAFCIAVGNPCKPIKHWSPETASFEKIINK